MCKKRKQIDHRYVFLHKDCIFLMLYFVMNSKMFATIVTETNINYFKCSLFQYKNIIDTYINLFHLSGQADYNTAIRISLITKKLYSIQSRFWHENVQKSSLYHISTI